MKCKVPLFHNEFLIFFDKKNDGDSFVARIENMGRVRN